MYLEIDDGFKQLIFSLLIKEVTTVKVYYEEGGGIFNLNS